MASKGRSGAHHLGVLAPARRPIGTSPRPGSILQRANARTRAGRALCVVVTGALLLGLTAPANALPPPPVNPSDEDISQSQTDASNASVEVGRLSGLVVTTQGNIDRLKNDMELKAELAQKAAIDLDLANQDAIKADANATAAATEAADSQGAIDQAQTKANGFAAASFRQGSELGSLSALLDSGSANDLLQRQQLLGAISKSQLNVMQDLDNARVVKANLDAAARQALLDAQAAKAAADAAKLAADQAQADAATAFSVGQAELDALQSQLSDQKIAYEAAANTVDALQDQRTKYNDWLVLKAAEEERLRKEAAAAAAAEAARVAAEQAAAEESARVAAEQAAAAAAAAAAEAAAQAEQVRAAQQAAAEAAAAAQAEAALQAARDAAALAAQQAAEAAAAAAAVPFYATCDDARAAGKGPMNTSDPSYRTELDPNGNGIACEGQNTAVAATPAQPAAEEYYVTCDAARAAGRGAINKGESGYRAELDANNNGVACEGKAQYAQSITPSPSSSGGSRATGNRGQTIINAAMQWLGTQYAWGGGNSQGPTLGIRDGGTADAYGDYRKVGFDCSGLMIYAYAQVGISLPHYSGYQYQTGRKVSRDNLQPGDLVFWANNTSNAATIHHVAIWVGDGTIIEAPQSGSYVKVSTMRWNGYIGASRPGS